MKSVESRTVSAPKRAMSSSGETVLPRDFDIFSILPVAGIQARDHALVEEALERLLEMDEAHVLEDPADEPGVEQVQDRVLDAADVLVDRQPPVDARRVDHLLRVGRVEEPQVVPGRVDEGVHRVGLAARGPPHLGHRVFTKASDFSSGLPSAPRNSTSSGRSTGRSASGTGTTPQSGQWTAGIGVPQ